MKTTLAVPNVIIPANELYIQYLVKKFGVERQVILETAGAVGISVRRIAEFLEEREKMVDQINNNLN